MVLNKEDKEYIKELFNSLDSKLSKQEITEGFFKLKIPSGEKDVQTFLEHVDANHDGHVDYAEFEKFTNKNIKKLKEVFDSLDTNKNGTLDLFEIQESIKKLNLPVYSEQEIVRLFNRIDKNKDNAIDFNEWRELLVMIPNTGLQHILAFWKDAQILDASFDGGGSIPPMVETKEKKSALQNTLTVSNHYYFSFPFFKFINILIFEFYYSI
ncbi:hypothetical protein DICPUDRAFT_32589 [Dictyostelium purpureum]|uniref:EF-hand domain-containing protein n=1 Tax=Dictyostelium purpureum TaxID=5786 RepID=F0ZJB5_DICPU|nr:uncharacterized protein DICPUDRAFT_32589 [Dictyostelium purpureum]EGC35933.1 hypothetical protein DICPUDRAFT_32589 [Dictyostelium purpureum]|eukprot:XP_003287506.1 hypothetical protein DICPUDRAFT_32589 [Dictyostelium purpureum]